MFCFSCPVSWDRERENQFQTFHLLGECLFLWHFFFSLDSHHIPHSVVCLFLVSSVSSFFSLEDLQFECGLFGGLLFKFQLLGGFYLVFPLLASGFISTKHDTKHCVMLFIFIFFSLFSAFLSLLAWEHRSPHIVLHYWVFCCCNLNN